MLSFNLSYCIIEKEINAPWDNEFLNKYNIFKILDDNTINEMQRYDKFKEVVKSVDNLIDREALKIMLFTLEFDNRDCEESYKSHIAYNPDKEEFYVVNYYPTKKEYKYLNLATIKYIILEHLL